MESAAFVATCPHKSKHTKRHLYSPYLVGRRGMGSSEMFYIQDSPTGGPILAIIARKWRLGQPKDGATEAIWDVPR